MWNRCRWFAVLVIFVVAFGAHAQLQTDKTEVVEVGSRSHCGALTSVSQQFPTSGTARTEWHLCVETVAGNGLIIRRAFFNRSLAPLELPIEVLFEGRVAEIFVPYHAGNPRFYDVGFGFSLLPLTSGHCPASGTLIASGRVCREVRDRDIAWGDDFMVRRGQALVLTAVLDAANYNYIQQWSFHDDGAIEGRLGSTGPTLGGSMDGHMHDITWRLDVDLNGAAGDSVYWKRHKEQLAPPSTGTDSASRINTERSIPWADASFTTVEVRDATLTNTNGRPTGYELIPLRSGTAIHSEPFLGTGRDFWVLQEHAGETTASSLPSYDTNESVVNADVVLWYSGSIHHETNMRDEDMHTVPTKWVGFRLENKNLFAGTPLYP